jgi:PEGA domain-containing protein
MRRLGILAFAFWAAVAVLSADSVQLKIVTDPTGASVVLGGKELGISPVLVTSDMGKDFLKGKQCGFIESLRVTWASGAGVVMERIDVCPEGGKTQTVTFLRPPVPALEIDETFARQVQDVAIDQQQAALDAYRALLKQQRPLNLDFVNPAGYLRSCRSELRLGTVYTTCTDLRPRPEPYRIETIRSDGPPRGRRLEWPSLGSP